MGIFSFFNTNKKELLEISNIDRQIPLKGDTTKGGKAPIGYTYREPAIFGYSLTDWKYATECARAENEANRIDLADIYTFFTNHDSQTVTAIQQRKLYSMQGDIAFYNEDGTINEEATKLIQSPSGSTNRWFRDFMSHTLDSIFWGFELVYLDLQGDDIIIRKVPERNIVPTEGFYFLDTQKLRVNDNMISFVEGKHDFPTIKISYSSDLTDLGLLNGIAPYVFSKTLSLWKQHAEKFGMPIRVLKTNTDDDRKMNSAYDMFNNWMRGMAVQISPDDELEFMTDPRTDMSIYKELNEACDAAISKIILGQTSTTDEKSYSGSANVHKSVLESIVRSDREFIEAVVNDQLVPKLQLLGKLPQNVYFGISEQVETNLVEQATIVKTISDAGFKIDSEYIMNTFNIPVIEKEDISETNKDKE